MPPLSLRKPLLMILLLALGGCVLAPGMKRDDDKQSDLDLPIMKDGHLTTGKVPVTDLTAQLIVERENATRQAIAIPKP